MKVKILLMPLTLVIAVALLIWYVYPAFSNGSNGALDDYNQLKKENSQLSDIAQKISNADSLAAQLANNQDAETTLMDFIPDNIQEEQVMDNLNYLASSNGLAVLGIKITQPSDSTASTPPSADGAASAPAPAPTATDFTVNYSVLGTYSQVKSLLVKLNAFGRYNEVASINIEKAADQNANPTIDSLQANMVLDFNFLKPAALSTDSNPIFSSSKLNTGIINQIKNSQNVPVLKLTVGQHGKINPFIP